MKIAYFIHRSRALASEGKGKTEEVIAEEIEEAVAYVREIVAKYIDLK